MLDNPKALDIYVSELGPPSARSWLAPTHIYVKSIQCLRQHGVTVRAISHITGGGLYENVPRMMKEGLTARIRTASYPVPAIFELIQKSGDIPVRDMYNTFNMGIGLVIAIPKDQWATRWTCWPGRAVLCHRRRDQGRRRRGAGLRAGRMVRIAVLVSGGGTNLQALIDAQSRGELKNGRIAAVLSSRPDAYALSGRPGPASPAMWWPGKTSHPTGR